MLLFIVGFLPNLQHHIRPNKNVYEPLSFLGMDPGSRASASSMRCMLEAELVYLTSQLSRSDILLSILHVFSGVI